METSVSDAQEQLQAAEEALRRTKRAIAEAGASTLLIMWGFIWIAGFLSSQFVPKFEVWIWLALDVPGIAATVYLAWWRRSPVTSPLSSKLLVFWFLLFGYGLLWIFLLRPSTSTRIGAFAVTLVMFGYVVMGLLCERFMLWLGLAVTALTVAGLLLNESYFCVWMAVCGGGLLAGTGLFIRKYWR